MPDVVIFDLDGTILRVNSFRLWVSYLIRARFPHLGEFQRLRISFVTVRALLARKLGLITHEALKWRLQKLWQKTAAGDGGVLERDFIDVLTRFVRPELAAVLSAVAAGEIDAVLATAAAGDYAYGLGKSLGFQHIVATSPHREAAEPSTVGVFKRDAVLDLIAGLGWQDRRRVLFTDHEDDLPLIRVSQTIYWFGSESDRLEIQRYLPGISINPGLQGGDIL